MHLCLNFCPYFVILITVIKKDIRGHSSVTSMPNRDGVGVSNFLRKHNARTTNCIHLYNNDIGYETSDQTTLENAY